MKTIKLNENEQIKYVKNTSNKYCVTTQGRVFTMDYHQTGTIMEMKQTITKKGYLTSAVRIIGKSSNQKVHRLVASAFIPNPENKSQINHIDGNKKNNRVENIEWSTPKENVIHSVENNLAKPQNGMMNRSKVI